MEKTMINHWSSISTPDLWRLEQPNSCCSLGPNITPIRLAPTRHQPIRQRLQHCAAVDTDSASALFPSTFWTTSKPLLNLGATVGHLLVDAIRRPFYWIWGNSNTWSASVSWSGLGTTDHCLVLTPDHKTSIENLEKNVSFGWALVNHPDRLLLQIIRNRLLT